MAGEEQWQEFWRRHEPLVAMVDATDEGFWADLADLVESVHAQRWTTRGAVVREVPRTQNAATQTERPEGHREVAIQTEVEEPRPSTGPPREDGTEREQRAAAIPAIPRGCWNCREEGHRYSNCPRLMSRFCFGCGQRGTTLRSCLRCGPQYRLVGPYSGWRGPRDGPAPQPRAVPWEETLEYDSDDEEWMWRRAPRGSGHGAR